ncbi:hypothetical protein I4U23_028006 [Adineta vaga]|nr:hypothetical protein I4U23_028006 [Adineta vaga]
MLSVETENDEEIARFLQEEYNLRSRSPSPVSVKKFKFDHVQDISKPQINQIDDDGEMALILQIEEIVLLENQINEKTTQVTDSQLEQTHAAMTKALQPTQQTDFMGRIFGMFTTIQTRFTNCHTKNQVLIDQIQKLSIQFFPLLVSIKTQPTKAISKAAVPDLAIGLITNVLQGNIEYNDAKEIISNMLQMWNDCSIWYEFIEQLVYILVAISIPAFGQSAMGKLMDHISSSK